MKTKNFLINILISSFLAFTTLNCATAKDINSSNVEQKIKTINNLQINWLDNYLESIILNLTIKKIDLQLNILKAYENDTNKLNSLFFNKDFKFSDIQSLNDYKILLENKFTDLKVGLTTNNLIHFDNDFNTTKLLNINNFNLKNDNLSIIPFIRSYQQILKNNQQNNKILKQEIIQGKRSEFDIHFTTINDLDNQIFFKKAVKIYFIEKLKQQPTIANFNELNSYLIKPLNVSNLNF